MLLKNNKSTIFLTQSRDINITPILFLHGFGGSSKSWDYIRKHINIPSIAIDLPGHAKSSFLDSNIGYNYQDFQSELYLIIKKLKLRKIHLCGYSMGGRLAVAYSQKYPDTVKSLILESAQLGIINHDERNDRLAKDILLSDELNQNYVKFFKNWNKKEMFQYQEERNPLEFAKQNEIRSNHIPKQLSKSLLSFSIGNMPDFIEPFSSFDFPIYLINGHDDTKYIKISRDMMKVHKKSKQFIVNNASHNVHLENKESFIDIINNSIVI